MAATLGSTCLFSSAKTETLGNGLKLYYSGSAEYKRSNKPYNSDLTFQPTVIARCQNEADVIKAVNYARENNLKPSIKSGGHSFIGSSFNNGGIIIDVSGLRQKLYQSKSKRFLAGPGLKLAEVNDYLLNNGRLLPSGSCGGVGLSGLTLGGGYGFFARQHGLTCDHLQHVRMVKADGSIITSTEDPSLLWACRGGGNGHFGVITSMEYSTVPAPKKFTTQKFRVHNVTVKRAQQLMKSWFEIASQLPDPIFSGFIMNGTTVVILISSTYSHRGPAFQKAKKAFLKLGAKTKGIYSRPTAIGIKIYSGRPTPIPFRNMSAGFYKGYQDIEKVSAEICETTINNKGIIFQINTMGGRIDDKQAAANSAYPHRSYPFLGELQSYWQSDRHKTKLLTAVEKIRKSLLHISNHYANYPDAGLTNPSQSYYGENLPQLQALKKKWDPENFFSSPQGLIEKES